ncbi:MAG: FmdB family transcriptional regulator [Opitutaceae bacterium]|jgi:hypothetical protein|nr:FmdB family transcriptional regulator [Opitutaceae bacterium]
MPIYEYYCPDNHTIYQFFARTLAQGQTIPPCPANPKWRMEKRVSSFAIMRRAKTPSAAAPDTPDEGAEPAADDPRMEAAMDAMEREFAHVDENDPRAMARMMRRMSELTGEKIDGRMEDILRKLEKGADPESLEDELDADTDESADDESAATAKDAAADAASAEDGAAAATTTITTTGAKAAAAAKDSAAKKAGRLRFKIRHRLPARRDPKLYDYDED